MEKTVLRTHFLQKPARSKGADKRKRKHTYFVRVSAFFLLASCSSFSGTDNKAAPFSVSTENANSQTIASARGDDLPRSIKINVNIGTRSDLKVKTGDKLQAGDVLTDRCDERAALEQQRKQLNLSLEQIAASVQAARKPFDKLPDVSFDAEYATIRRAETLVSNLNERAKRQRLKLAQMEKMNLPESVAAHERALLTAIEAEIKAAESEQDLTGARLKTAREKRRFDEFQNAVRVEKDNADYQKTLQAAAINAAQINSQIAAIDSQLQKLGIVRVPFDGTIERISYEGQKENEISVVIYFTVDDSGAGAND